LLVVCLWKSWVDAELQARVEAEFAC